MTGIALKFWYKAEAPVAVSAPAAVRCNSAMFPSSQSLPP
jgi:hypothetical protein